MNESIPLALVAIGSLVFLAHLFTSLYNRKMVPDVFMLLIIGLFIGPVLHIVSPDDFGVIGPVFTSITLVVILFEGGTSLSISMLKSSWKSTLVLTFSCFIASMLVVVGISSLLFGFPLLDAITLGAILGGTSSAVVLPLVKQLSIGEKSKTTLILESAMTDVLCIVVALACVHTFQNGNLDIGFALKSFMLSFVMAILIGVAGAMIWSSVLEWIRHIQNSIFTTPAFVFVIYGITELLGYNGAIATLAFGITIANINLFPNYIVNRVLNGGHKLNDTELVFLREITFLLKTFFFVYIGLSIVFNNVRPLLYGMLITAALYACRFLLAKFVSPKNATGFDKSIISIMTPKGLAAAVLATIPEQAGMTEGSLIKNMTFAVVFFSIFVTSLLIFLNNRHGHLRRFYSSFFKTKQESGEVAPADSLPGEEI